MTRQQRRKMEREQKKGNNRQPSSEKQEIIKHRGLGFTICDLETIETYDVIPKGLNPSIINDTLRKSMSVYQNTFLLDVENNGVSSPCVIGIIHNVEEGMYDEEVMNDLLISVLRPFISSPNNNCRKTLNHNTRFRTVLCLGMELDSSVLDGLSEYLENSVVDDVEFLKSTIMEFGQTG